MDVDRLKKKYRQIHICKSLKLWAFIAMILTGLIAIAGNFISFSLWGDYELQSDYDISLTMTMIGIAWMGICGVVCIVVFAKEHFFYMRPEQDLKEEQRILGRKNVEEALAPTKAGPYFLTGSAVLAVLIVIIGNLFMWQACPVDRAEREAVCAYAMECFPGSSAQIEKQSGHQEVLMITKEKSDDKYNASRMIWIDFMMNSNQLDQENVVIFGEYDLRKCTVSDIIADFEESISTLDESVFEDGNLSYLEEEVPLIERQVKNLIADPTQENYKKTLQNLQGDEDISAYLDISIDTLSSYEGEEYHCVSVRIHVINLRW